MTELRIGDIVKIERGEEGEPGYLVKVVTVVKGRTCKDSEMPLPEVERHREKSSVTVIKRAPKFGTALVKYDCKLMPAIVKSDGKMILSNGETVPRIRIDEDSLIETCPYVPAGLIKRAEEWYAGNSEWDADNILSAIVGSVRDYRDGLQ